MEPKYNLFVSQTEAQAILTALSELPIKTGLGLFQNILGQLQAQEKPPEASAPQPAPAE